MKIATWNVNSIKARMPNVLDWLAEATPDVVLLQEIKTVEENFPAMEIEELGYNCAVHGQKSYNGVAILSKHPLSEVSMGLAGDKNDNQARYAEAWVEAGDDSVRVASIYVPMGTAVGDKKFDYKLNFLDRLITRFEKIRASGEAAVAPGRVTPPGPPPGRALCNVARSGAVEVTRDPNTRSGRVPAPTRGRAQPSAPGGEVPGRRSTYFPSVNQFS